MKLIKAFFNVIGFFVNSVIAVIVILLLAAAAYFLPPQLPRIRMHWTAYQFMTALQAEDYPKAFDMMARFSVEKIGEPDKLPEMLGMTGMKIERFEPAWIEIPMETPAGEGTAVAYKVVFAGSKKAQPIMVALLEEDGEWKVFATSLPTKVK